MAVDAMVDAVVQATAAEQVGVTLAYSVPAPTLSATATATASASASYTATLDASASSDISGSAELGVGTGTSLGVGTGIGQTNATGTAFDEDAARAAMRSAATSLADYAARGALADLNQRLTLTGFDPPRSMPVGRALSLVTALTNYVGRYLPARPWTPDPAWLKLPVPTTTLSLSAGATIALLLQAQADIQATFGLNVLVEAQLTAFVRIVATLNARMDALLQLPDSSPWERLASLQTQIATIEAALQSGLLPVVTLPTPAVIQPAGIAMPQWQALADQVAPLMPLLAMAQQNKIDLTLPNAVPELAAQLRVLAKVALPPLQPPGLVLRAMATLRAVATLRASLGVDVVAEGYVAVAATLQARLAATLPALAGQIRMDAAGTLSGLPDLPESLASTLTADVMARIAALPQQALSRMNWQVPPMQSLPLITTGLPVANFVEQAKAAVQSQLVRATPCGSGCDAAATLRAAQNPPAAAA